MNRDENKYANAACVDLVQTLNFEWLDLNALIIEIVACLRLNIIHCGIHLQLATVLPVFLADRDKLIKALSTLLSNIIKVLPVHSDIGISSSMAGRMVHISVRELSIRAEAFKNRYDAMLASWDFSLVRDIARMHGGLAWIEYVRNQGSIFHFTLRFAHNNPIGSERYFCN